MNKLISYNNFSYNFFLKNLPNFIINKFNNSPDYKSLFYKSNYYSLFSGNDYFNLGDIINDLSFVTNINVVNFNYNDDLNKHTLDNYSIFNFYKGNIYPIKSLNSLFVFIIIQHHPESNLTGYPHLNKFKFHIVNDNHDYYLQSIFNNGNIITLDMVKSFDTADDKFELKVNHLFINNKLMHSKDYYKYMFYDTDSEFINEIYYKSKFSALLYVNSSLLSDIPEI